MAKTVAQINEKIKSGKAVVVTAEEMVSIVAEKGVKAAAAQIDVVTTGTFGPMCSSSALLCLGHHNPKCKIQKAWLNDVPAYCGLAAVDMFIGATEMPDDDPLNKVFPGEFRYGGGHVIEDLVAGKEIRIRAVAHGTDCYPCKKFEGTIRLADLNQALLLNPRNSYQNYNVAVNRDNERTIYTYMGILRPKMANANYCSAGQLSPLLNDPYYRTIGIGSRIFLGGGIGYVYWEGTQHNPTVPRLENGTPRSPAGTLAVCGDLKQMKPEWLRGISMRGYGVTLNVGLGVPIPILDVEMARFTAVKDEDIVAQVVDYSTDYPYPSKAKGGLGQVTYAELKSGFITVDGKEIPTSGLSSYHHAREIAEELKGWILAGRFLLTEPVAALPGMESGQGFKPLKLGKLPEEV
ncbi:MAG: homocysteine biosynthesis protein [Planctomycetota bacterium]